MDRGEQTISHHGRFAGVTGLQHYDRPNSTAMVRFSDAALFNGLAIGILAFTTWADGQCGRTSSRQRLGASTHFSDADRDRSQAQKVE